jgi:hypothetical protein
MTRCSSVTPARWTALGLLCLVLSGSACSHSEPFGDSQESEQPFDAGPPARLTLNPGHDGHPSWLPDGSGILYSAQQVEREDDDVCLAELPATGGRQRRLVCDIPGDRQSTDAAQSAVASAEGPLALLSAGNGSLGGTSPAFLELALLESLDTRDAQRVRTLPFTPAGGTPQDYAGHLRWLSSDALVYIGQAFRIKRDCEPCPLDTVLLNTEVTILSLGSAATAGIAMPGTTQATGVTPVQEGAAILYTLAGDSRIYRRVLASGEVAVVHDFGSLGPARDVHAGGNRVTAIVGGRVTFTVHPLHPNLGPVQWDSGGVIHVVELGQPGSVALDTPGRLYRRPALSPDGGKVVAEGFPLIITGPIEDRDTTVGKSGDLYLFGAE